MKRLLVTLCTYNERENLEQLIPEVLAAATRGMQTAQSPAAADDGRDPAAADDDRDPAAADDDRDPASSTEPAPITVLVIDDGSPDGTGEFVEQFAQTDARVHLLQRGSKQGLGTATVAGFRYAIDHDYDWLLNLDADFSHPPRYIPDLIAAMHAADVAIGSRYVPGGSVGDWPLSRRLMSRMINFAARLLLGLRTRDNSGSFRSYRVQQLARIDWSQTIASGYAFQEEILYRCRRLGCTFQEVPIVFAERRFGETKISFRECTAAASVLLRLGWHHLLRRPVTGEKRSDG